MSRDGSVEEQELGSSFEVLFESNYSFGKGEEVLKPLGIRTKFSILYSCMGSPWSADLYTYSALGKKCLITRWALHLGI